MGYRGTVRVWRTDTGLLSCEYSQQSVDTWTNGSVVGIAMHPSDNFVAFAKWGQKQAVDVYEWDGESKALSLRETRQAGSHQQIQNIVQRSMSSGLDQLGIRSA